jgi:hypothetical protein
MVLSQDRLGYKNVKPLGRYGGHPGQKAASQLSPYRRDRIVVGEDRTGTCRATGTD